MICETTERRLEKRESNNPLFITVNTLTKPDTLSNFLSMSKAVAECMRGKRREGGISCFPYCEVIPRQRGFTAVAPSS